MSRFINSILSPFKKLADSATNKIKQAVIGNWGQDKPKDTGVFKSIEDIKKDLNSLEGKDRRQLVESLLDEFKIKDLRNTETENVLKVLERRLKKEENIPEENFNNQLFEIQNPLVNIGQNKSLKEIFDNNPNARVLVKPTNKPQFYLSKNGFDKWITDRNLGIDMDYRDVDLDQNIEILSIEEPDLLDFRRIERKNEIGGIDDLRISINEIENENYYCPTNLKCIRKCIIKFLKIKKDEETIKKLNELIEKKKDEKTYKVYKIQIKDVTKSNTVNKILKENNINYRVSFSYTRYKEYKKDKDIEVIPLKEVKLNGIGVGYSHAVLLKQKINLLYKSDKLFNEIKANKIELEEIDDFSKFEQQRYYEEEDKSGGIIKIPFFKTDTQEFKTNPLNIMTFDYEAHQIKEKKVTIKNGIFLEEDIIKQYPYMVSYAYRSQDRIIADYIWDMENPENVNKKLLKVIKKRIMKIIKESTKKYNEIKENDEKLKFKSTLTMVSHNGAGYDNHMFLRFLNDKNIEIKKYIGDESKIKTFEISFKDIKSTHSIRFVDSYLFTTQSLEDSCRAFGVEGKNKNIDISKILIKEEILNYEKEIIEYGKQDSKCLLELVENINKSAKEATGIDLSPFRYISLPSFAGKIRDEKSDMSNIWYHTRREIVDFEQGSVFGGRLIVGSLYHDKWESIKKDKEGIEMIKKHNIKNLEDANKLDQFLLHKWIIICKRNGMKNPDINSLYPTAMANYLYPFGKSKIIKDKNLCNKLCKKFNKNQYKNMCIVKCKIKVNPKCIIPLIPNKLKDGSVDTIQKEFICTATNIEIQEAIKHGGYEVLEVYMYEEWYQKKYIFKNFIEKMYSKRLEYKKLKKEANNPVEKKKYDILQEWCKLIMNASYGKIIQKPIDTQFRVTTVKEWTNELADQHNEYIQCINGKRNVLYKKQNKDVHDNKIPKYLGSFILSYSKKHMNNYISAVDGFFNPVVKYMDTDSLYFDVKYFDMLKEKGLIGDELGQATPDYDKDIEEYASLGKKIKFCKLTNGELKTTFKGFSGLKKLNEKEKNIFFEELKEIANEEKNAEDSDFMKKKITRLNKKGLNIIVEELSRNFKPTWKTHYQKINGWLYPKYYEV